MLKALLFDVVERGVFQVADHVRLDMEEPGGLSHLKLPRLQELRILGRDADLGELHPLFEDVQPVRLLKPAVFVFPGFLQAIMRVV
ncbi:hypothetical protein LCGC14_2926480 [marine sediment metagenome]|uniref:Uncharacterized protein n=1 Tax=marine sediment metagenome TaxID=412755 RepID=A0A0F8XMI0_9ZZZZ